ncbi:hypothetical protein Vi05172_g11129 [Venturia inaequalis]|nr:hypothetical protein Vi05172_g11129 [Venturia inaequalis]
MSVWDRLWETGDIMIYRYANGEPIGECGTILGICCIAFTSPRQSHTT